MNKQNERTLFNKYKKLIISNLIISVSLSLIGILVLDFLSSAIDGMVMGIVMGVIYAFCAFMIYFAISMGLCLFDSDLRFGKMISIGFIIATLFIILFFSISSNTGDDDTIGYKSGDYSQYSCEDCGKPADGGRWYVSSKPTQYYCYEHYTEHKKWSDEYNAKKEADKYKVTCGLCEKKFSRDSLDGKNIIADKYCIDCEATLIGFDRVWGD